MLNADIALNTIVEDWVESYQGAANDEAGEKEVVHQLVLFVIRCCGLQADVDEDEAMDLDGIADAVETIEEESAKVSYLNQTQNH
jgi:cohesin complex subunit SA-1/2